MAQVTLDLADYDSLREKLRTLEKTNRDLEAALQKATRVPIPPDARHLIEGLIQGAEVVRFAVANLDPETIRGWPHKALVTFAEAFSTLPDTGPHELELAGEFRRFAADAAKLEEERRLGIHKDREGRPRG